MASRFWVGGTGTWDASDTTHWAATSGGAGGQSVPVSGDTVTLDGSSGGGTVTVNTTVDVTSITMGAFTGTLDFSANNNNVTVNSFSGTGTATRTLNLGNGTWAINTTGTSWNMSTVTGLTFAANSSTIVMANTAASNKTFAGGGLTYNIVTINAAGTQLGGHAITGANTFATLNIASPNYIEFPSSTTTTITNAFTYTGTSLFPITLKSNSTGVSATVSIASGTPTIIFGALRDMTFSGGATFTARESFNLGHNSGITITAPSGGGAFPNFHPRIRIR